jgi:hypothetical protein
MQFSGGVTVTFAPGTAIKDGVLKATGGTSCTCNGVAFFLTGAGAGVQMSEQANWHLVAPSDGPLAGFVSFSIHKGRPDWLPNRPSCPARRKCISKA